METVQSNLPIVYPSGAAWDGKYVAFGDQEFQGGDTSALYQATDSASGLSLVASTVLSDPCGQLTDVVTPFVVTEKNTPASTKQGNMIIGSDEGCHYTVDFWAYPAGGQPTGTLKVSDPVPAGAVLSIKE